ncbi:hypothetical protein BH23BAC1_BH23BAC1_00240 [soil metagenome]
MFKYSSHIYFTTNYYPPAYSTDFTTYLFNDPEHLKHQLPASQSFFYIINDKDKTLAARIHFFIMESGEALSPYRSPFGSLEFSNSLDLKILGAFLQYFIEQLRNQNIQSVQITTFPFAYDEKNSIKLCHVLLEAGFTIPKSEFNHHLFHFKQDFEKNLHKMEWRKLKKAKQADLIFSPETAINLPYVYAFINECRAERNQSLSMQFSELAEIINHFPKNYFLYTVKIREKIIAATIVVKVNDKIWYNFYPASTIESNHLSPLVFLYNNILMNLPEEVEIFDLGTSHVQNQPNHGLIKFKERLGGIASLKFTYFMKLN